jgi:hypothetical protein
VKLVARVTIDFAVMLVIVFGVLFLRLVPVAAEQQALADMTRIRAEGLSLRHIADTLKARGLSISHQSVKRALDRDAGAIAAEGAA